MLPEVHLRWTMTSTGAAEAFDGGGLRLCRMLTFVVQANDSTATVGIEAGMSSTGTFVRMGSTAYLVGYGETQIVQMDGPIPAVRPYLVGPLSSTDGSVVVEVFGV